MYRFLLVALAAKVCLGQDQFLGGETEAAPSVFQSECPIMPELGSTTTLHVSSWSFLRTVDILQPSSQMNDAGSGQAQIGWGDELEFAAETTPAPTHIHLGTLLGQVKQKFSWTSEMALLDPNTNKEVAKIVNPGVLWDTTQDIYDCQGRLMGSLQYDFDWKNLFTNSYVPHRVYDAQGNHIANLLEESQTESLFGSGQHFVYMADLQGSPVASMRRPSGGWKAGPFGEYFNCNIEMQGMNMQIPPPAMNPEFVSLVFANALAGEHRLGPYISMIVWPVLILFLLICGVHLLRNALELVLNVLTCCWCCGLCGGGEQGKPETKAEENAKLIEKEVKDEKRGVWSCCSRRQVAPGGGEKPKW